MTSIADIPTQSPNSDSDSISKSSSNAVQVRKRLPRTVSIEGIQQVAKKARFTSPFTSKKYTNLLSEQTCHVLFATDEWFARADNLIQDHAPVFDPDLYCSEGKVMDGWETRRKRTEGHDWCVIATNTKSTPSSAAKPLNDVVGIELDTAYFTGNQAPRISIEVANCTTTTDDMESKVTWMPGAIQRLANGGGIQGTGQTPQQIQTAQAACDQFTWKTILPMTPLQPGYEETKMHYFMLDDATRALAKGFTHVKINYFPDGGVARMKLWGFVNSDEEDAAAGSERCSGSSSTSSEDGDSGLINEMKEKIIPSSLPYHHPELSLSTNGGVGLKCSNKHYGEPDNLIRPTYGKDMGDGWETARHPNRPPVLIRDPTTNLIDNPLMDWAVLKLGMGGAAANEGVSRIIIDTKHFKGNFPESVMVEGCNADSIEASDIDVCISPEAGKVEWFPLLPRSTMGPDQEHVFDQEHGQLMNSKARVTHVRVSIFPDGGISRVRIYGKAERK